MRTKRELSRLLESLVFPAAGLLLMTTFFLTATILEVQAACEPENFCESCDANGKCTKCLLYYGYQPLTGYCEQCGENCFECNPIGGNCTRCFDRYGPAFSSVNASCGLCLSTNCVYGCKEQGAGKCDRCDSGFGPNPTFTQCTPCVENCQVCITNTSYCDTCYKGWSLFDPGNKTCGACSQYCTQKGCFKAGPGFCDQCDSGYFYFRNNKACGECAAHCLSCLVNGASQCDNCTFGYGLTPTNTCEPCSAHCTMKGCNIIGAYKCDECDVGYGLLPNGSCEECAENCSSCLVNGASQCDNCTFGYGLTTNNTCAPCSKYCMMNGCFNAGAGFCDKCDTGYLYFRNNETCGDCAANCSSCLVNGAGQCDNCTFGYGLTTNNTCAPCGDHCTDGCAVNGAGNCDKCDPGFELTANKTCAQITTTVLPTTIQPTTILPTTTPNPTSTTGARTTTAVITSGSSSVVTTSGATTNTGTREMVTTYTDVLDTTKKTPTNALSNEVDWRVLLTLLMLIIGGLLISLISVGVWMARFAWGRRRHRKLKEEKDS